MLEFNTEPTRQYIVTVPL